MGLSHLLCRSVVAADPLESLIPASLSKDGVYGGFLQAKTRNVLRYMLDRSVLNEVALREVAIGTGSPCTVLFGEL